MLEREGESDTVPLRIQCDRIDSPPPTLPTRGYLTYSKDHYLGGTGWLCCAVGLGIFAAVAAATTLPGLQEQMLWQKDECYVVSQERGCADEVSSSSSSSSISSGQKCAKRVAVKVVLSRAPICKGPVCKKREGIVVYQGPDPGSETHQAHPDSIWLLEHELNSTSVCYENESANKIAFEPPPDNFYNSMIAPVAACFLFILAACILIPAWIQPNGVFRRCLDRCGIHKRENESEKGQKMTVTNTPNSSREGPYRSNSATLPTAAQEGRQGVQGMVRQASQQVVSRESSQHVVSRDASQVRLDSAAGILPV